MRSATVFLLGLLLGMGTMAAPVQAQEPAPTFTPRDERIEDLPAGPGREETFGMCTACHGYRLVSNQGMNREKWDETLTWMNERHKMPEIQGGERDLILD